MNFYFIFVLTTVAFTSQVFGVLPKLKNYILKIAENTTLISEKYAKLQKKGTNPCSIIRSQIVELNRAGLSSIDDISFQVLFGISTGKNGFHLIVDDSTSVQIPAIIKCTPKYKNGTSMLVDNENFVFYLILYMKGNRTCFERAEVTNELETEFILPEARAIRDFLETYKKKSLRDRVKSWFEEAADRGKFLCTNLVNLGRCRERHSLEWSILDGTIQTDGPFYLRISKNKKIILIGIIKCDVNVKKLLNNEPITDREDKYFTVVKIEPNNNNSVTFNYIFGPRFQNRTQLFAIHEHLL